MVIRPKRYTTLEGMRGIAAICVVLKHGESLFGAAAPQSAHLAVDFFFVLSGFIIAHAYSEPLRLGFGAAPFMRARVIRLYPLYIAGTVSTVALATASILLRHDGALWAFTQPVVSFPFAAFMLPSPASSVLFPLNAPAWTLLLELIVNAAFAVRWLRSIPAMVVMMGVSGVALLVAAERFGTLDIGWGKDSAIWGLARVFFGFPFGVILYRVHRRIKVANALSVVPALALALLLFANPAGEARIVFELGVVFAGAPLLVLAGAISRPTNAGLIRLYLVLGAISYPLYVLHHPILMAVSGSISRHLPAGPATIAAGCAVFVALLVASWYAAVVDGRLGRTLHRRFRRIAVPVEAS